MNKIELKQCPFCSGKAESLTPWAGGVYGYWVRCEACGCETAVYGTREQAERHGTKGRVNKMSDDLISRKSLIENLNKFALEHYSALVNDLIMKEPTAFDRKKVVEELKQNRDVAEAEYKAVEEFGHDGSELLGKATAFNLAMAIVEKAFW